MIDPAAPPGSPDGLPPELFAMTEQIAERIHDLWAANRRREGWRYGAHRNDLTREHPCLVPYAELPDHEKQYDRDTAFGTLRTILDLGYRILPPTAPADTPDPGT